jgi:predicted membrane protein
MEVDWIAVVAAGISAFALGGIWYGPLFGKAWQAAVGLSDEQVKSASMVKIMGGSLILSLIAAFVFAMFLGPNPGLQFGTAAGFAAGLCWVAASFGISYLFEQRPLKLWLINGGYHTLQFTLYGGIIGWLG